MRKNLPCSFEQMYVNQLNELSGTLGNGLFWSTRNEQRYQFLIIKIVNHCQLVFTLDKFCV